MQLLFTDEVERFVAGSTQLSDETLQVGAVVVQVELDVHPLQEDVGQEHPGHWLEEIGRQDFALKTLGTTVSIELNLLDFL